MEPISESSKPSAGHEPPACPPPWEEDEEIREQFRGIRVIMRSIDRPHPCIAVTSTVVGEGVSWVAARLACAVAEDTPSVCLVDAHDERPGQRGLFGVGVAARRGGLRASLPLVSQATSWPGLSIVTPESRNGALSPDALIQALRELLPDLKSADCTPVLDCEAMRESGQVLRLAGVVDAVLYVVEAERERREVVARAQEALRRAGLPILGVVLNKRRRYLPAPIYRAL